MEFTTLASRADMKVPVPTATSTHHLRETVREAAFVWSSARTGPQGTRTAGGRNRRARREAWQYPNR